MSLYPLGLGVSAIITSALKSNERGARAAHRLQIQPRPETEAHSHRDRDMAGGCTGGKMARDAALKAPPCEVVEFPHKWRHDL